MNDPTTQATEAVLQRILSLTEAGASLQEAASLFARNINDSDVWRELDDDKGDGGVSWHKDWPDEITFTWQGDIYAFIYVIGGVPTVNLVGDLDGATFSKSYPIHGNVVGYMYTLCRMITQAIKAYNKKAATKKVTLSWVIYQT